MEFFGLSIQALAAQLMVGLVNGSSYAMLSLGLAVIFGLLGVVNFAHGAMYMVGAFVAYAGAQWFGMNYWVSLVVSPLVVGLIGILIERSSLRFLYKLDPIYGLLLTFGLALIFEGLMFQQFGSNGQQVARPEVFEGSVDLGFMILPIYRLWVVVASLAVCLGTWFLIERTPLGALLRAGTENPRLVQAFGVNVPLMVTLTYAGGAALAGLAGVLAAPVILVKPAMGSEIIIVVFAVVVIGGMGSIMGSIVTGLLVGLVQGLTRAYFAQASDVIVFVLMALVLVIRPAGLFGKEK
jgi:branched-chain amino acid transport system permease protein